MTMKAITPLVLSFEFFPPKTLEGMQNLRETGKKLAKYSPEFFSVTFGAGGSTREGTIEAVNILKSNTKVTLSPHLACIASSHEEITTVLKSYQDIGIKRIVALRGDLPSGVGHLGDYQYASDLVALIREILGDSIHISVAAYPEIHPQAKSAKDDLLNLKRKFEAGANSAITQYFFNPDAYFYYIDECQKQHITMPIIPGIMPITQFSKLARFSDMCGAEIPRWIRSRLESYEDDLDATKKFGLEVVYHLCERLISGGAPGLHFYTLNKSEAVIKLLDNLIMTHPRAFLCSQDFNVMRA